jgi:S1-C subfamily serine protease
MRINVMKFAGAMILVIGALPIAARPARAQSVSEAFEKVKDSVVVVRTVEKHLPILPGGEPLTAAGLGSGVFIDAEKAYVMTAAHVIQASEAIEVEFTSGEVIRAHAISSDPSADVALLKLEKRPLEATVAPLGDSDDARVGEQIFIVGAPLGISHTLTVGHLSARRMARKLFGGFSTAELFQTDAAVNHGNSGGPMFNMDGEVIGIVSSMITRSGGYEGLGFVITSNTARQILLEEGARWSGMEGVYLSGDSARLFNVPQRLGLLVQRIAAGSPADKMGILGGTVEAQIEGEEIILGGDIILEVNGIKLSEEDGPEKIKANIRQMAPGQEMKVIVLRGGRRVELLAVPF